jgi:hypothetical protein
MVEPVRIDNLSRQEKAEYQRMLIDLNYLPSHNAHGKPNDDGIWGTVTAGAYAAYLADQRIFTPLLAPAAAKPWWQSRRGQGVIKMGVGLALGIAGNFWEPAANVDSTLLLDTIFTHLPTILEALGLGVAGWGATQSAVGAAQAEAPLTLRRPAPAPVPQRVRDPSVQADPASPGRPESSRSRDARGGFRDLP